MSQNFQPGDFLVFQLEAGFALLRPGLSGPTALPFRPEPPTGNAVTVMLARFPAL